MSLSEQQVQQVAYLARLGIDAEQASDYADKLSNILNYVEQMNAVNTDGVEPMAHPLAITQPCREDQVTETNQREKMQALAPATENGLYLVPKVIE